MGSLHIKSLTLLVFSFIGINGISQSDCDSNACAQYAQPGTYTVLSNGNETDHGQEPDLQLITCETLCFIEESRSNHADVIIQWGAYRILVHQNPLTEKIEK